MDTTVMQDILDEVFSAMETLEAQNGAILQFLKDRGIASHEDLAPFLEKAATTSNVRWRAARIRVDHVLASAARAKEISQEKSRESSETRKDQQVPQSSEVQRDSEEHEQPAERTGEDSGAAKDGRTVEQTKETGREGAGTPEKPATKDAA